MKLPGPVQVEMYPDHEDFAVRTMGMPGLGALGVTFGEVVAMDSPSGRKPGDFNWGATLWHEMSHVFIITATGGRVPRWFTEGLAVHEEGQRSPEWSDRVTPEVLAAIRDKKLLPVAKLDRGFVLSRVSLAGHRVVLSGRPASATSSRGNGATRSCSTWCMPTRSASPRRRPSRPASANQPHRSLTANTAPGSTSKYGAEAAHFDEWRSGLKKLVAANKAKQPDIGSRTRRRSPRRDVSAVHRRRECL